MTVKVIFHTFTMGDVDDVEIYIAGPIEQWQETEKGQWVMEHATDLRYYSDPDPTTMGHRITIRGNLEEINATEYFLRWK